MKAVRLMAVGAALLTAAPVFALEPDSPLLQGFYVAPMYSYVNPDNDRRLDDGSGGALAFGYRVSEAFAVELFGVYTGLDREDGAGSATMSGGGIGALAFVGESVLPGLYIPFAVGYLNTDKQAASGSRYEGLSFEAGLGYLFPLSFGRYDLAVRAEARFRHNSGQDSDHLAENDKRGTEDALFNLGLQLPFGKRPAPTPEPPVVVVPVAAACSDGVDNDGDGRADFPDDAGCTGADDNDETDPRQCSDGHDNDGDGLADFPEDPGCASVQDGDETDPCELRGVDGTVSLGGCGRGDVLRLDGVNFEHDKARLTIDAKTVLDGVATELLKHPAIHVEIGGHTDSRGSDAYNLNLSERRAAEVVEYLRAAGVDAARMIAVGFGEARPVADNETEEGRERNRRVELRILSAD